MTDSRGGRASVAPVTVKRLVSTALCYVAGNFAYFTTKPLSEQWGDDWDDAPYEHNAGTPYSPCWHNEPGHRNNPNSKRGWRPGTQTPYSAGEMCRCASCVKDWGEDGTPKWEIIKIGWDGDFSPPCENHTNSPWSVQQINSGAAPWLFTRWAKTPVSIPAGVSVEEFRRLIELGGGSVFIKC